MKTPELIRRENLKTIVNPDVHGNIRRAADKLGYTEGYLSQILNGYRNIGDKAARKIEKIFGLAAHGLDVSGGPSQDPVQIAIERDSDLTIEEKNSLNHSLRTYRENRRMRISVGAIPLPTMQDSGKRQGK